jgi:kumamolisin
VTGLLPIEQTWSGGQGATGGGISNVFPVPPWQAIAGLPASVNPDQPPGRGIPDIAGYVGPYSILLGGTYTPVLGTSVTAPFYAGLVSLLNASMNRHVGYLNPLLYKMAGSDVFRDINDGINNSFHGSLGYTSGPGWDACTGLGSVDGRSLLNALKSNF